MQNTTRYFIKTFGCQQNYADSERIESTLKNKGYKKAKNISSANYVVVNTCMVRESAENKAYGYIKKLHANNNRKIILTGCMVGAALKDSTGKYLEKLKRVIPSVDEFLPIEEVGYDIVPLRTSPTHALVPISNGCNNFCTYCVVPYTRGREVSRSYLDVINEIKQLKQNGYKIITLLGQNVNSYGSDLIYNANNKSSLLHNNKQLKITYVKHLGRMRIPTLFPELLSEAARMGFDKVDFISSNPWDFSDDLIKTIKKYKNITRILHIPLQSGDNAVLKRMNRWYTTQEYEKLIQKIKKNIPNVQFTTDIIVGFCQETEKEFQNTIHFCKKINFLKAYIAVYSPRPLTTSKKLLHDTVPADVKKRRFAILDELINKPNLLKSAGIHKYN